MFNKNYWIILFLLFICALDIKFVNASAFEQHIKVYETSIVSSSQPYANWGKAWVEMYNESPPSVLMVKNYTTTWGDAKVVSFLKFNISSISSSDYIRRASLYVKVKERINPAMVWVKHCESNDWSENTITWFNMPEYEGARSYSSASEEEWCNWTITTHLRNAIDEEMDFLSLVLQVAGLWGSGSPPGSYGFSADSWHDYSGLIIYYDEKTEFVPYIEIIYEDATGDLNIVVSSNGEFLSGVKIDFLNMPSNQETIPGVTNVFGELSLDSIKEGDYVLNISKKGYKNNVVSYYLTRGKINELNVELEKIITSLSIVVENSDGKPIADAKVISTSQPSGQNILNSKTDTAGKCLFDQIKPGSYNIMVTHNDYLSDSITINCYTDEIKEYIIILQKPSAQTTQQEADKSNEGIPGFSLISIIIGILFSTRTLLERLKASSHTPRNSTKTMQPTLDSV